MHELSLAQNVLDMVEAAARRDGFLRVGQLRLEVGALAGVEVQALRFALAALTPGSCLEQAQLHIDTPSGTGWCKACTQTNAINGYLDACPRCAGPLTQHAGGNQLRILDLLVFDD